MSTNEGIRTHGRVFTGVVESAKMQSTVVVSWTGRKYVPKYERYLSRRGRIKVHNPAEINARKGDVVRVMECRPLSKTKHFVVVEKLGHERLFEAQEELKEESKVRKKKVLRGSEDVVAGPESRDEGS